MGERQRSIGLSCSLMLGDDDEDGDLPKILKLNAL